MNKKFLSAVLFGALMVSSTGTFVSCKDYDEDIDRIDKELVDIKSALSALQAKVDAGKYVTNVVKNGDGITVTWSDNSTSTIETIKGDKGEDGKNGTVVTIIDGYWAFDGVKSEYPAKGDKGDKGDQGEPGDAAAAGHDAKISENGYWMVWDTEKAAYVETEYIAGGAVAAQVKGGWNITVKDENGDEQTIFIPSSATMGYMDVLNGANPMIRRMAPPAAKRSRTPPTALLTCANSPPAHPSRPSPPSRTAAASRRCPPARKTRGNTWPGAAPA